MLATRVNMGVLAVMGLISTTAFVRAGTRMPTVRQVGQTVLLATQSEMM